MSRVCHIHGDAQELEEKILKMLEESKGNILDDEVLINTLNTSKLTSAVIKGRVKEAEQTEREIIVSRNEFRPVLAPPAHLHLAAQMPQSQLTPIVCFNVLDDFPLP